MSMGQRQDLRPGNNEIAIAAASRSHFLKQLHDLTIRSAAHKFVSPTAYAFVYAGLHDRQETLHWLEEGYRADAHVMVQLREPAFDFVRQEPRFQEIYRKVPFSH